MPVSVRLKKQLRPAIEAAAKKLPNGFYSNSEDIIAALEKKTRQRWSEYTLAKCVSYARIANGVILLTGSKNDIEIGDEDYLENRKKEVKNKSTDKQIKDREKYFLSEITKLEKLLTASANISKTPQIYRIEKQKSKHSQSTPVIFASDWHYEEEVKSETVSGLNKYNLEIADCRIKNFINNSTRLLAIHSKETEIRDVIFCLGGDFVTGDIHRDNIESCLLSPTESIWAVQNHIASCIEHYLKETDFNFIIPCHSGNHARTTKEQLWANEAGHSLEWLMYHNLARWFKGNKRLQFMIADGLHLYVDVNGFVERTHHGHAVKYGGGVGGLTIPVNKAIAQWNKGKWASHDSFGHFHTYFPASNFTCNGSAVGFNPFAMSIKADFEKPVQAFSLINHEQKMISINAKIFL